MSDRILSPEDQSNLEKAFEKVKEEDAGKGIHEKYHQLAHALVKTLDRL